MERHPTGHQHITASELLRWSAYNLRWSGDFILTHFFGFRFVSFFLFGADKKLKWAMSLADDLVSALDGGGGNSVTWRQDRVSVPHAKRIICLFVLSCFVYYSLI
jgi:hypothetical protein